MVKVTLDTLPSFSLYRLTRLVKFLSTYSFYFLRRLICRVGFTMVLVISFFSSFSQQRCATVEYEEMLRAEKKLPAKDDQRFEQWLQQKIQQRLKQKGTHRIQSTYQIPVVVHVIHNGESIGAGVNISNAQILSQISVLNRDYNRLNTDASNTPSEFLSLAGSMNIEFVMAKRTPEGLATNGILRKQGPKNSWSFNDNSVLKSESFWPSEDYLNIWVCNLTDYLGYAQFPVSNLPGLEEYQNGIAPTDGAVFSHKVFGSVDDGPFTLNPQYNKGRTATHELGHFFGLRHIWGDEGQCSGTDYVDDTPNQTKETYNCPSHPQPAAEWCTSVPMFQNYLDYTDDGCMNLFTQGQANRMISVLENSPRRKSLLTSPGLLESTVQGNDLTIVKIISPSPVTCDDRVTPKIKVRVNATENENTVITNFTIHYTVNQGTLKSSAFTNLNLIAGEEIEVTLPEIRLNEETNLFFEVREPNGGIDIVSSNNTQEATIILNTQQDVIPIKENFTGPLDDEWTITNPLNGMLWETIEVNDNTALYFNGFTNATLNDESWFVSPSLDFSKTSKASLIFDYSYAKRTDKTDRFKVLVSTDCGNTFTSLYDVPLMGLVNATSWQPSVAEVWFKETIDLNEFVGTQNMRFAFVFTNGNGNNFYLDNINFFVPNKISAHPNPATEWVNVSFNLTDSEEASIEIIDTMGKVVKQQFITDAKAQTFPIPLNELARGVYIVRVRTTSQIWSSKLLITQ